MSEANLLSVANIYMSTRLKADSALAALVTASVSLADPSPLPRIVADFSLETVAGQATYPLVSFNFMSGRNILTMGARRIYTNCLYAAVAHGIGGYGVISPIADRVVAALDKQSSAPIVYDGTTYFVDSFCEREIQVPPAVIPGGQVAYARGSVVRLYIGVPS